jgi:hypothetical protein
MLEEALELSRDTGDRALMSWVLYYTALVSRRMGHYDKARARAEEIVCHSDELGTRQSAAWPLKVLASIAQSEGRFAEAMRHVRKGILISRELGEHLRLAWSLDDLAGICAECKSARQAVMIYGASYAIFLAGGMHQLPLVEERERDVDLASCREQMGDTDFEAAWKEGQAMTPEQADQYALGVIDSHSLSAI